MNLTVESGGMKELEFWGTSITVCHLSVGSTATSDNAYNLSRYDTGCLSGKTQTFTFLTLFN